MPILASEALLHDNKKIQWKMLTPVGLEPGPLIKFQGQHYSFWTNLACAT